MQVAPKRAPSSTRLRAASALVAALFVLPLLAAAATASAPVPDSARPVPLAFISAFSFKDARYLIVTPSAYASAMQSIADWKTQKGVRAQVASLEDIELSYLGRDNAEKVHNFLQDVYFNASGKQLKYVLLGGGAALVPIRYLYTHGSVVTSYTHDSVFSDVYYAGLDSDWDTNGNGVFGEYGEEDWNANVFVGRLPFNSAAEAGFVRDNLLSYEQTPFVGSWMKSAAAFASVMDPPNNRYPPNEYDWFEDNALRSIDNTRPFLPATMTLDLLADYYELPVGNYTTSGDRLSNATMVASISAGKSVVISVTHGWVPSGKGVPEYRGFDGIDYSWGEGLTYHNASNFTNFGQLSFGYFSSCLIGNFSDPTLPNLGRFVVLDNHGFIAEVVPTDGTLRGEDDFATLGIREGNWWQSENFWKNFFTGADPFRPGPALYEGIGDYDVHIREVNRDSSWGGYRTQKAVYNLLGDPEVPIWTDVALSFNATWPSVLYSAEQHFRASLRDTLGRPAAGASVTLMGPGVYQTAVADSNGRLDAIVTPTSTGSLRATATLHNFLPVTVVIPVQSAPPDLAIEPQNVTLPSPFLRTDDPVQIGIAVRNVGQLSSGATDVRVYDTPPSGVARLVGAPLSLLALAAGEGTAFATPWTPSEDGIHSLRVVIDAGAAVAEFDEFNNEVTLLVKVSSVDLSLDAGGISLNPPGQVAPGGVITVTGTLGRIGLVPRPYLVGYELLRADGSAEGSGNVQATAATTAFTFDLSVGGPGDFTLRITTDAADEVIEFDESNNAVDFAVHAGAGPAILALPAVRLDEDALTTAAIVDLRAFVSDPDTPFSQLSFNASSSASDLIVWVDGWVLYALPSPDWSGGGLITLEVRDDHASFVAFTPFTVASVPDAPTIDPPRTLEAKVGEPFVYRVNASDADGDALAFSYPDSGTGSFTQLPGDSGGLVAFVPTPDQAGYWTFWVTVTDATNRTASTQVSLIIMPSDRPPSLVDLGPIEVRRGQAARISLAAQDPDGDPVTFSADHFLATVSPSGTLYIAKDDLERLPLGATTFTITVSDGLMEAQGNVTVVVLAEEAAAPNAYGNELVVWGTTLAAAAAAAAGAILILARPRRRD